MRCFCSYIIKDKLICSLHKLYSEISNCRNQTAFLGGTRHEKNPFIFDGSFPYAAFSRRLCSNSRPLKLRYYSRHSRNGKFRLDRKKRTSNRNRSRSANNGSRGQHKTFFYRESNARIELFSAKINSNEGKEYEIVAYVYCTTGRLDHMPDNEHIYGFTGFDLFEDGVLVDYIEPIVGFLGQVGKKYDKDETEEYFEVIHLDGGDIFACIYPFTEDRHTAKLWYTVYLTVRNGEITFIPRYFTEEEQKAIDESPGLGPCPYDAIYNYYAPRNYRVEGNRIIYTLDADASDEIEGLMQKEVTYPAGEIPVLFDFENNTAKCEKDEYKDVFYMHFDLD